MHVSSTPSQRERGEQIYADVEGFADPLNPCFRAAADHSVDNTTAMLQEWLKGVQNQYHSVEWRLMEQPR